VEIRVKPSPMRGRNLAKRLFMENTMAKKAAAKTTAPKPKKISPASKPRSKSELYATVSDQTGLPKKQVAGLFDAFTSIMAADLSSRGPKIVTVPGLMKVYVKRMPAKKAREGINPRTGETMMFKAKPARDVVKVRALKTLKAMV
jgi:nucleoid DNA-binding protein